MGRGSVTSWQDFGRRNSAGMAQLSGNPSNFVISDNIEFKREDGYFLTYAKAASFCILVILIIIVAGFLGSYFRPLPKTKQYDALALLIDEERENAVTAKISTSAFVYPLKYRIDLSLIMEGNRVAKIKGRVVIEFRVDSVPRLSTLSLDARNITVTGYKLSLMDQDEIKARSRRRRRRRFAGETNDDNREKDSRTGSTDPNVATDNSVTTMHELHENVTEYPLETTNKLQEESRVKLTQNLSSNIGSDTQEGVVRDKSEPGDIAVKLYEMDDETGVHNVHMVDPLKSATYALCIDYEVTIDGRGIYVANYTESDGDQWLLATQANFMDVARFVPVFDDMKSKSLFSLSVEHPKGIKVLSNMPLKTSRDTSQDRLTDIFDETPLLSSYNLGIVVGYVQSIDEMQIPDSNATAVFWGDPKRYSQGIYLRGKLESVMINLIDVFSMPYPLPKLDLIGLPPDIDDNVGKPGLILIKESLLYTTDRSPLIAKTEALEAFLYLLGQQWLGGLVNANNWTDAWILDGSLLNFQYKLIEKIDSSLSSSNSFVIDVQLKSMEVDGYSISRPLGANLNPLRLDSSEMNERYMKGACLIRMLHGVINSTAFRNGYSKLIARWQYKNVDVLEFLNVIAEEVNDLPADMSLVDAMNTWISQSGYPLVIVTRDYEKGSIMIHQERFMYDTLSEEILSWPIPLTYATEDANWTSPMKTWLQSEGEVTLDQIISNASWIIFNINRTGYYRVNYDEENWRLLGTALQENHEVFPAETRAALIDDIFSLAAVGLTKYETAFDFIKYMQMRERHYAPWAAFLHHTLKLNNHLYETTALVTFQEFVLKFVSPLYDDMKSKLQEGSQLTRIAVQFACTFEHVECIDWSSRAIAKLNNDSNIEDVVPLYIRETLYCTIARYGTRKTWNYFMERMRSTIDREEKNQILSSFACFQAPWILYHILNEVLYEDAYDKEEIQTILKFFPQNPPAAQVAFKFVRANWQIIGTR
uniref:Thyrotropin-releasing hormone-degrading ectoenzyme n=1 Tax=Ampulex compressa TaxID=860918 RepID=A0A1W6EWE2_AMPCP|nr:thyrotropin-releasing hormone-degrading ectoenzyme [Ampulex compressa]